MAKVRGAGPKVQAVVVGPASPSRARAARIGAAVFLAAAVVTVLVAHAGLFFASWTDENIHLYVARRVSEGAALYRDIDSARPPLVIYPLAALLKLHISPLWAARGLVLLASLATAGVLFLGGRRLFGARAAVLAAGLYLLSPELLARTPYTGIQLVQLAATGCLVLALLGRPLGAGVVFGLALGAGQHALVLGALAGLWCVLRQRRRGLWFLAGAAGALAAIFGLARLLGAQHLWQNLIARHLYHLGGKADTNDLGKLLLSWVADNLPFFVLALVAVVGRPGAAAPAADRPVPPALAARALGGAVALHFVVLLAMSGGLLLYAVPAFALVCLLAGAGADRLAIWVAAAAGATRWHRGLGVGAALAVFTWIGWAAARGQQETDDREPLALFPPARVRERTRMQKLDRATTIAGDLAEKLPPAATIFGHGTIAAQVAMQSGRRVAAELADLAPRWIEQGTITRASIIGGIENDNVGALVSPRWILTRDRVFSAYLQQCYWRPRIYPRPKGDGRGIPDLLVFVRRDLPRPCLPPDPLPERPRRPSFD